MSVGIPVKLLYEGIGHAVTIEIKSGIVYRGILGNVEDNMNCLMDSVSCTYKDGQVTSLEQVYIRGNQIRFMIFPDMLRHSPMFKLAQGSKGKARALGLAGMRRAMQMRERGGGGPRGRGRGRGS
ncbi:LSM domain-containing protein [Cardiosporidium cionae]|uniref:Small nuclear ribonucleoprotein Sm D3 n=1 Tax=Cardiosporidium cionae TaxID=476202 RepID=A0ABQ7J3X7_9APIC|nr:LSM domain-containing protein [Cardiosporidium cionae]|eukprot:KAF8817778.1 LSM domain-containing protein [Cardiosporidium cionae]